MIYSGSMRLCPSRAKDFFANFLRHGLSDPPCLAPDDAPNTPLDRPFSKRDRDRIDHNAITAILRSL